MTSNEDVWVDSQIQHNGWAFTFRSPLSPHWLQVLAEMLGTLRKIILKRLPAWDYLHRLLSPCVFRGYRIESTAHHFLLCPFANQAWFPFGTGPTLLSWPAALRYMWEEWHVVHIPVQSKVLGYHSSCGHQNRPKEGFLPWLILKFCPSICPSSSMRESNVDFLFLLPLSASHSFFLLLLTDRSFFTDSDGILI